MKKLQRKTLGLALLALVAFGGVNASAKQTARQQVLSGVVMSIDLGARTIQVREQGTGRTLSVRVPEGKTMRTNLATSPSLPIERLLPGMVIRDIVVQ
jgi:HAMP domain-containing protein